MRAVLIKSAEEFIEVTAGFTVTVWLDSLKVTTSDSIPEIRTTSPHVPRSSETAPSERLNVQLLSEPLPEA